MAWFANYYKHIECGVEWDDEWDCMCNDKCPDCNAEIEPYYSEELDRGDNVIDEIMHAQDVYDYEI